ncbi:D-galactonate transporter [Geobacillus sp. BCO2]|nr:D-galactonate transporter [Geobacillus sp. BCO2]
MKHKRRWAMAFLIALGVIINYFDRINMSVGIQPLSKEFGLTPGQLGILLSAFAWSYAILQIPAGVILDKIGVKWVTRIGTIIWTVACFLTAVASGQGLVMLSRVLLGIGEAPYFPSAAKAVGQWFPRHERATAIALYDAQSKLSNAIGTPIIAWIITEWGWRAGFYTTAVLSFIYAILFWATYRDPHEDKRLSKEEYNYIVQGGAQKSDETSGNVWETIRYLLTKKKVWATLIGFAAYGYSWFLFLTWLPGYLATEMHMSVLNRWYARFRGSSVRFRRSRSADGSSIGLSTKEAIQRACEKRFGHRHAAWAVRHRRRFHDKPKHRDPLHFNCPWRPSHHVLDCLQHSDIYCAARHGRDVDRLVDVRQQLDGDCRPIVTGFIVQATGSFMYAFLVAAFILLAGIFSYLFLLTDLEPIEPMARPETTQNASIGHIKVR